MKPFCANFLLQPVSTDGFFQKPVDIETARTRGNVLFL